MLVKAFAGILILIVALPVVQSYIDTGPYTHLVSEISQKEAAVRAAHLAGDFDRAAALNREADALKEELASPQMVFLKSYSNVLPFLEESDYLSLKAKETFPENSVDSISVLGTVRSDISSLESLYDSGDYAAAMSLLKNLSQSVMALPAALASVSAGWTASLRNNMQRTVRVTPSTLSMLNTAETRFKEAEKLYSVALNAQQVQDSLSSARALYDEGCDLVSRAKATGSTEPVKWILLVVPIILVLGLLAYFYMRFKRQAIVCTASRGTVLAGRGGEVERRITIANPEKETIFMTVSDSPPTNLTAFDFDLQPEEVSGGNLVWGFEMAPDGVKTIAYKLRVPPLDAGSSFILPGATAIYELKGKEKRLVGKNLEIKVV